MALDEPRDDDEQFAVDGLTFLMNQELYNQVKPVKVDFVQTQMGDRFFIDSNLKQQQGDSCCSGCSC